MIVVADDEAPMGAVSGRVNPTPVPVGVTDVTFDFPPDRQWAVWVNPRPNSGPLFLRQDIPRDASGKAPFTIDIDGNGEPSSGFSGDTPPGWFGE